MTTRTSARSKAAAAADAATDATKDAAETAAEKLDQVQESVADTAKETVSKAQETARAATEAATARAEAAADTAKQAADAVKDAAGSAAEAATTQASAAAESVAKSATDLVEGLRDAAGRNFERFESMLSEMRERWGGFANFGDGDGLAPARQAITEGLNELTKTVVDFTRASVADSYEATKAAANAATLKDVVAIQTQYAQNRMQAAVDYAQTVFGILSRMGREAAAPVTGPVSNLWPGKKDQ